MAGFRSALRTFEGNYLAKDIYAELQSATYAIKIDRPWPLSVATILTRTFQAPPSVRVQVSSTGRLVFRGMPLKRVRLLPLLLKVSADPRDTEEVPSQSSPAACGRWMPTSAPEAVEALRVPAAAGLVSSAIDLRSPNLSEARIAAAALLAGYYRQWARVPAPQPAESMLVSAMADAAGAAIPAIPPAFAQIRAAASRLILSFCDQAKPGPLAEPAERLVSASVTPAMRYPAAMAIPAFDRLAEAPVQVAIPALHTGHHRVPAAEAVEMWLAASVAGAVPYPASIASAKLAGIARGGVPAACTEPQSIPAPEAAEMWLAPSLSGAVQYPVVAALPALEGTANSPTLASSGHLTIPGAEAVERFVVVRSADALTYSSAAVLPCAGSLRLDTTLDSRLVETLPEPAQAFRFMAEEVSPRIPETRAAGVGTSACASTVRPTVEAPSLAAIAPAAPAAVVRLSGRVPGPAAQPAERFVFAMAVVTPGFAAPELMAPQISNLAATGTHVRLSSRLARPMAAEPVVVGVHPTASLTAVDFAVEPPRLDFRLHTAAGPLAPPARSTAPEPEIPAAPLRIQERPQMRVAAILQFPGAAAIGRPQSEPARPRTAAVAPPAECTEAEPVESMPAPAKIVPLPASPQVLAPPARLDVAGSSRLSTVGFETFLPAAQTPDTDPVRRPGILDPIAASDAAFTLGQPERPLPAIPTPGPLPLEFYCQRVAGVASQRLRWIRSEILPVLQPFGLRAVADKPEDLFARPRKAAPPADKVRALPLPSKSYNGAGIGYIGKIAAGLLVAAFLWTGGKLVSSSGRQSSPTSDLRAPAESTPVTASSRETVAAPEAPAGNGTLARVRQAIAKRAAVEVADTFHGGMQAWGSAGNTPAPGWSKHPDGYMRTGELALFRPSQGFTDYRLEFYGQIESKSMGWAVRARDKQNYQAMKFSVIEPGLRPIIAMIHYPVVGGKKGHRVATPLSVMVHNNRPYHVTVDVRGNHFTTSIEGEEVDSFTDDTLASGGIGFFSEAGEKARLYWAKVSKNQDWLGRICSYLAADGPRRTAEIRGPGGADRPLPGDPFPGERTLAAAFIGFTRFKSNSQKRRIPSWIC